MDCSATYALRTTTRMPSVTAVDVTLTRSDIVSSQAHSTTFARIGVLFGSGFGLFSNIGRGRPSDGHERAGWWWTYVDGGARGGRPDGDDVTGRCRARAERARRGAGSGAGAGGHGAADGRRGGQQARVARGPEQPARHHRLGGGRADPGRLPPGPAPAQGSHRRRRR